MQEFLRGSIKKNAVIAAILISIGVIAGVIISSNLGWIPLGRPGLNLFHPGSHSI